MSLCSYVIWLLLFLKDYFPCVGQTVCFSFLQNWVIFEVDVLEERLKVISMHSHTCTLLLYSEASWWFDLEGPTLSAIKCLTDCFYSGAVQFNVNYFTDCFRL